ncbi:MAG TPA: type II toxin-antitoxin system HicB family antitoxin [Thermoanaerobaculia bacterium]|nr:type II toxin-antitoxin system HicB family antitoxin [Thermoanaerobaculia bacterium]
MSDEEKTPLTGQYEIDLVPNEHGGYYARVPDFPTIFTGGRTPDEAMQNALAAIELMLEEQHDRGLPIPSPLVSFSGQFNVRIPRTLHRELVRRAEVQGVSLNALVSFLLAQVTGLESEARSANRRKARAS